MFEAKKSPLVTRTVVAPGRRADLLIETVGGETLIYDESRHKAFCLNEVASAVWKSCDGLRTSAQIAGAATLELGRPVSEDVVVLAVEDFRRDELLEALSEQIPAAMLSRRELAMKLGVGAAMMMPVVAAIVAPKAAQAYTGCVDCE